MSLCFWGLGNLFHSVIIISPPCVISSNCRHHPWGCITKKRKQHSHQNCWHTHTFWSLFPTHSMITKNRGYTNGKASFTYSGEWFNLLLWMDTSAGQLKHFEVITCPVLYFSLSLHVFLSVFISVKWAIPTHSRLFDTCLVFEGEDGGWTCISAKAQMQ